MQDTLNLQELTTRIQAEKSHVRGFWLTLLGIIVFLAAIFICISVLPRPSSPPQEECDQACTVTAFLVLCTPFSLTGIGIVAFLNWRYRNAAAKPYLVRLPNLDLPPAKNVWRSPFFVFVVFSVIWALVWLIIFDQVYVGLVNIPLIVVIMEWPLLIILYVLYAYVRVLQALFRGNYAKAAAQEKKLSRWIGYEPGICASDGALYIFSGEPSESEATSLKQVAQALKSQAYQAWALNSYALELVLQKRFDEALSVIEITIQSHPNFSASYDTLAIWYLRQNIDPERALELATFGLNMKSSSIDLLQVYSRNAAMGHQAWAKARNGLRDQAQAGMRKALKKITPKIVPYFVEMNFTAGETYLALNDIPTARQHFAKAAEVDPNGRIGKMARERLETLPPDNETRPS